jgi:hypothetical protein
MPCTTHFLYFTMLTIPFNASSYRTHWYLRFLNFFLLFHIVTDFTNALPGNSSVNTVQHATMEEPMFSMRWSHATCILNLGTGTDTGVSLTVRTLDPSFIFKNVKLSSSAWMSYMSCSKAVDEIVHLLQCSPYKDWIRAGWRRIREFRVKNFLFSISSRLDLGPTQSPIQWISGVISPGVEWPGREADHSTRTSADVKENVGLYIHFLTCFHGVLLY